MFTKLVTISVCCLALLVTTVALTGQETETMEMVDIKLAEGAMNMKAPKAWSKVEPKSSMLELEFSIAAKEETEDKPGRLTIMRAGGGVEANIARWKGQFSQPDGSSTDDHCKVEEIEVSGMPAHIVDIKGTYADRPRMTAPPTMRENYRMLAAIVESDKGMYFVKFYGPSATVDANAKYFNEFIKSITMVK